MNRINPRYVIAGVLVALAALSLFGVHPLGGPEVFAGMGGALLIGDTVHSNVLEMFKGTGINWKPGVDPEVAISKMRQLSNTRLSPEELGKLAADGRLSKGFNQPATATSGLAQYDLEQGAKLLYPITTILRNMIPRLTGGTGIQSNWRAVTAVNPTNLNIGLSEGHRGGFMGQTVVDRLAPFKTSGMDDFVTLQAYLAGVTFEDLYALAATTLLQGTMEAEEKLILGGNSTIALGTTPTPAGTPHTTGGTLADASTYSVICVALTPLGMMTSTPPTTQATTPTGGAIALPYVRTNADGSTDNITGFSAAQSAASSAVNVSGGSGAGSITCTVTAVNGAIGYAWYLGLTAGTERLVAITGYPTSTLVKLNASGQLAAAAPSTDQSTNSLNFDGILSQIMASGSGAYVRDLGGAALTTSGSGSGGIAEFDTLIADRIANYRLVPTDIIMSPVDQAAASATLLTGNTNLAPFFMGDGGLSAAAQMKVYNNKVGFGNQQLQVHAHPFLPAGTAIFYSRSNPYPLSNVPQLLRMLLRRDYWQVNWPVVTNNNTMGVYFDGVLQMYFPPAFGVITGIKSA